MIYWQMVWDGGWVMWIIVFCAIVSVFLFLQKCFQFYRAQVNVDELITGLINVLRRDRMIEAITLCDNTPGPVARLLTSAIHAYQNGDDIKEALESQSLIEVPRLETRLNILATLAYVAPLLGLLGTVTGMVEAFRAMSISGASATLTDLSKGIYQALSCTAAGLCVAIPCHIAYNYLLSQVQEFCVEMEKGSAEIIYFFKHHVKGEVPDEN